MDALHLPAGHDPLPERLDAVEPFVRTLFEELHLRCQQEKEQYETRQNSLITSNYASRFHLFAAFSWLKQMAHTCNCNQQYHMTSHTREKSEIRSGTLRLRRGKFLQLRRWISGMGTLVRRMSTASQKQSEVSAILRWEKVGCDWGHTSRSRLFLQSFDDFRSGQHFSKDGTCLGCLGTRLNDIWHDHATKKNINKLLYASLNCHCTGTISYYCHSVDIFQTCK